MTNPDTFSEVVKTLSNVGYFAASVAYYNEHILSGFMSSNVVFAMNNFDVIQQFLETPEK